MMGRDWPHLTKFNSIGVIRFIFGTFIAYCLLLLEDVKSLKNGPLKNDGLP